MYETELTYNKERRLLLAIDNIGHNASTKSSQKIRNNNATKYNNKLKYTNRAAI